MIDPVDLDALYDDVEDVDAASAIDEDLVEAAWSSLSDFMTRAKLTAAPPDVDHVVVASWIRWATTRRPEFRPTCGRVVGPLTPNAIHVYLLGIKEKLARWGITGVVEHGLVRRMFFKTKKDAEPVRQARPLTNDLVHRILDKLEDDRLSDVRHRAMLLLGRASGGRNSEILFARVKDLRIDEHGLVLTVWGSKTNPTAKPEHICVPRAEDASDCAVAALEAWLARAQITTGYVFRAVHWRVDKVIGSGPVTLQQYARTIKSLVRRIGEDPAEFSGYSTRRGFATVAYNENLPMSWIGERLRHGKGSAITSRYVDDGNEFGADGALL